MSPIIIGAIVMASVALAGFALAPMFAGDRGSERAKRFRSEGGAGTLNIAERQREERRKEMLQNMQRQSKEAQKAAKRVPLDLRLYQAGMKLKPAGYIRNSLILGGLVFAVMFILQVPLLFAVIISASTAYLGPRWYVSRRRRKYQTKFLDELPNAIEAMVRGVKSGLPLNDSIRVVAKEVKEPVRSEFSRVLDNQAMGHTMEEAIKTIFKRVPLPEINFLVVVVTVQAQSGGNLSEALGNLARVLRDRRKMAAKVKAMSSEAKASAMIIGSLPFIVAGLVSLVSPTYLLPLFTTTVGYICLGVAAVMMSLGVFIMSRMIRFDY